MPRHLVFIHHVSTLDPEHSQNVVGSKFGQDPSSDFILEGPISSNCVIQLWKKAKFFLGPRQ